MKFIKNSLATIGIISLSGLFIFAVQNAPSDDAIAKEDSERSEYNVYALSIPEKLNFAGEVMPLKDVDVYERMDRELLVNTYWQSNGLLMFKRAQRYFPIIEPILKKHGIPDDFKYLAVIESGLVNAVSPAGARGVWQFMPATGKDFGMEINTNVDERYNVALSTELACQYLLKSKKSLGSWTLAAAGYNAGNAGIARRLKEQNVNDYYDLLLGEETGRYIFRIVALKEIMSHPKKYGFNFSEGDLYQHIPTKDVVVDYAIPDLVAFAQAQGINYKILKIHNPWLREPHLNNTSKKRYTIKIPEKGYYKS